MTTHADPDYDGLTHDAYLDAYEEDDVPDPWYAPIPGAPTTPRAYWTPNRGGEDGTIVLDEDRLDGWQDTLFDLLFLLLGFRLGLRGLVPHEWAHAAGEEHPERDGVKGWWLYLTDVMGVGLRYKDRRNVVERSYEWRREHGLLDDTLGGNLG